MKLKKEKRFNMLNKEEVRLINVLLHEVELKNEEEKKLVKKLEYIVEQFDITEELQEKLAQVQDKIVALNEVKENEEK